MILLAGVLIVLAFFLYSTQSTLVSSIGQEAGREAANPLLVDHQSIRGNIALGLSYELRDVHAKSRCPTDESDYAQRVQAMLVLMSKLESNRGQVFVGNFLDMVPAAQMDADSNKELQTKIRLYLTNGRATISETVTFITDCID